MALAGVRDVSPCGGPRRTSPDICLIALISNDLDQDKEGIKARIDTLLAVLDNEPVKTGAVGRPIVRPRSSMQSAVDTDLIPALEETAARRPESSTSGSSTSRPPFVGFA